MATLALYSTGIPASAAHSSHGHAHCSHFNFLFLFGRPAIVSKLKCNHSDDEETAVQQFRDFVMQTYKFRDTASARGMRLKSISAVMGAPRPGYDMLGRTSHLIEDLTTIFKLLGYNSTVIARLSSTSAYHCISSCAMLGYNYTTSGRQLMIEGLETDDISKFAEKKSENRLVKWRSFTCYLW